MVREDFKVFHGGRHVVLNERPAPNKGKQVSIISSIHPVWFSESGKFVIDDIFELVGFHY